MPRPARFVLASAPHHVTQRGNHRQRVFFSDGDHLAYLHWLREYATSSDVEIIGYCLMPNHVHLVLVPARATALPQMMQHLNSRYAKRINREREWNGHLWQGRYFASVLDDIYFWIALRYVELNPQRAGMVERAEDYAWSSARAHCGLRVDAALSRQPCWQRQLDGISDWSAWLQQGCALQELAMLRTSTAKSQPCGSGSFIESLEAAAGRPLRTQPRGRRRGSGVAKKKAKKEVSDTS